MARLFTQSSHYIAGNNPQRTAASSTAKVLRTKMTMKWTLRVMFPCMMLVALCSSLPVHSSLRDKSAKTMLKQRRNGGDMSRMEYIQLIAREIGQMDSNNDGQMDRQELEDMFLTMMQGIDVDTAQYLVDYVFGSKEFAHNDGKLPINDLATFFNDVSDMGIF